MRGVSINCEAELIDDYETVHELNFDVVMRNQSGVTAEQARKFTADMSRKKTVIVVRPQVMSWDPRKLDGV